MSAPQSVAMKARVPLARTEHGDLAFITVEWLNILKQLEASITAAGTGSTFDPTDLIASINTNAMHIAELQAQALDFERRITALEGGYER
jgi:hypothetical protein